MHPVLVGATPRYIVVLRRSKMIIYRRSVESHRRSGGWVDMRPVYNRKYSKHSTMVSDLSQQATNMM